MVMSMDSKKIQQSNGKSITPKAPIRSKSGPYLAPKLANPARTTPNSEPRNGTRVVGIDFSAKRPDLDELTTPVKSFLSSNITPRSSSRRSRAGSAASTPGSTPGGTPDTSRPGSITIPEEQLQGLRINGPARERDTTEESFASEPSPTMTNRSMALGASSVGSAKFFHASEANSIPKKGSPSLSRTGSGFVYADGRREEPVVRTGPKVGSRPASQVGAQPRLYSSNGASVTGQSPKSGSPTTSPKLSNPVMARNYPGARQRSTSPLKEFETPGIQALPKVRRISGSSGISLAGTNVSTATKLPARAAGQIGNMDQRMHIKTQSMSSLDAHISPQPVRPQQDPILYPLQSPESTRDLAISPSFFNIQSSQLASPIIPTTPFGSPDPAAPVVGNTIDHLNSLATNARRERKVLDLEISNSSLLAINRTLEREMRKQKTELRRYRRLTSGGRLSIAPTNRAVSGTTTISTLSFGSDENIDSEEEHTLTDIESEDEDGISSDSDNSDPSLSPGAQAAKDARQRARDEKRLQLDLARHQQLLTDSQKMNESLKRCLGWTEELILEGKKALEYQVRVGEVKLGGRVLHEDDNPDLQDAQPRHGLLSPTRLTTSDNDPWTSGASPSGTIVHQPDSSYVSAMADEGKEFREYLESLEEPGR